MIVKAIIFDFDGPINDSFREGLRRIEIICDLYAIAFTRGRRRKLTELWGRPGVELLYEGLELPDIEKAKELYKKWEILDIKNPVPLIPGARKMLCWTIQHGIVNTLLTSRHDGHLMELLRHPDIDLIDKFSIIQARSKMGVKKPDPKVAEYTFNELAKLGITKQETIFIGDTPEDIKTGEAIGVETLVVMSGPYWLEHFLQYPVKQQNIIADVSYLDEWLFRYADNIQ